jgi:hypothetical protein
MAAAPFSLSLGSTYGITLTLMCLCRYEPRLPDGSFSNQKSNFGYILEGLRNENVVIFYSHLEYLTAIGFILWQSGKFSGQLVYFFRFLVCCTKKNLATLVRTRGILISG